MLSAGISSTWPGRGSTAGRPARRCRSAAGPRRGTRRGRRPGCGWRPRRRPPSAPAWRCSGWPRRSGCSRSISAGTCGNRLVEVVSGASVAATGDGAGGLVSGRFNRHRNGYRMRSKPPGRRRPQPGPVSHLPNRFPSQGRQERTRNPVARAFPGHPGPARARAAGFFTTDGQLRRNAVRTHGVKLDAAPDAPPWGEVLDCPPPVPDRNQRRAVAATDFHPSPYRHTRQARTVRGGGRCEAARTRPAVWACRSSPASLLVSAGRDSIPASCRTARCRTAGCKTARGWRIAQQLARPIGRSVTAGGRDRICGRRPCPGKDPS